MDEDDKFQKSNKLLDRGAEAYRMVITEKHKNIMNMQQS